MMYQFLTTALHGHISTCDSYGCYTYFTGETLEAEGLGNLHKRLHDYQVFSSIRLGAMT